MPDPEPLTDPLGTTDNNPAVHLTARQPGGLEEEGASPSSPAETFTEAGRGAEEPPAVGPRHREAPSTATVPSSLSSPADLQGYFTLCAGPGFPLGWHVHAAPPARAPLLLLLLLLLRLLPAFHGGPSLSSDVKPKARSPNGVKKANRLLELKGTAHEVIDTMLTVVTMALLEPPSYTMPPNHTTPAGSGERRALLSPGRRGRRREAAT
jgi:hypothetical protein